MYVDDRPGERRTTGERGTEPATLRGRTGRRRVRGRRIPTGGDVVVAVDGGPVRAHEENNCATSSSTRPGDTVDVTVLRGGEPDELTLPVRLSERPATEDRVPVR